MPKIATILHKGKPILKAIHSSLEGKYKKGDVIERPYSDNGKIKASHYEVIRRDPTESGVKVRVRRR